MWRRSSRQSTASSSGLPPLKTFILPGGAPKGAALHLARTVCRRAERGVVRLAREIPVSPAIGIYLNRLSDLLFVLARAANARAGARGHAVVSIRVPLHEVRDRSYDILIDRALLARLPALVAEQCPAARYALISDSHVASLYGEPLAAALRGAGMSAELFTFPAGRMEQDARDLDRAVRPAARRRRWGGTEP